MDDKTPRGSSSELNQARIVKNSLSCSGQVPLTVDGAGLISLGRKMGLSVRANMSSTRATLSA